jgi:hypothetical protein
MCEAPCENNDPLDRLYILASIVRMIFMEDICMNMEETISSRNKLLLISLILGVVVLLVHFIVINAPNPMMDGEPVSDYSLEGLQFGPLIAYFANLFKILSVICCLAALVLIFLGWLKNNSKIAFIATFFYIPFIFSTNVFSIVLAIASMILCIIGSNQLKKKMQ